MFFVWASLSGTVGRPVADQLKYKHITPTHKSVRRGPSDSVRPVPRQFTSEVAGHTAANRIRVIRDYLDWLVKDRLTHLGVRNH